MDKHVVNRLILIGNGFDRAHGLETSYNDFIVWYMTQCFAKAEENDTHDDPIVTINRNRYMELRAGNNSGLNNYVQHFYNNGFTGVENNQVSLRDALDQKHTNPFEVKIKSEFFRRLLSKCSETSWVEIENEYYIFLKEILNSDKKEKRPEVLAELHNRFAFIIEQLQKYLSEIPMPKPIKGYQDIFRSHILEKDIASVSKNIIGSKLPEETLILNFNYTPTVEAYLTPQNTVNPKNHTQINYIHGQLGKEDNPVIFGFGDELDSDYEKMELEKAKGFLAYIKSFWYFKTSNYHNLIRFLDAADFQAVILGHSCGLSDRTMLNMIFEHPNCISVKIYYHGNKENNNYTNITQAISPHFRNKPQMRRRIVPLDKSEPMPQLTH
ncbi:hypothetical protein D3C87_1319440 [compost metagenome]